MSFTLNEIFVADLQFFFTDALDLFSSEEACSRLFRIGGEAAFTVIDAALLE